MEVIKTRKQVVEIHEMLNRSESVEFFLTGDWHIDNPKCKRDVLFEHLDLAKKRNAKIIINGDLFCMMQGKYDPRRSKSDIRPEHNKADYIDAVIRDTVEILKPYKDHIIAIADGNHETGILKNLETDVIERFCILFNERYKTKVVHAPYNGWFVFNLFKAGLYFKVKYKHGYGGGGPVTKGTIQHARENMWTENADAIWMGHTHDCYAMPVAVERFQANKSSGFQPSICTVWDIRTPSYKHEYKEGGWAIEKGHPPRVMGGVFMRLTVKTTETTGRYIQSHFTPEIQPFFTD